MSLKIDSHQHFWKYDPVRYSWIDNSMKKIKRNFLPGDLEPVLRKNGFDGCIAVQADQSEAETDFLLKLASHNHMVKGVIGWLDLTSPEFTEKLTECADNPYLKGLRHTHYDKAGEFMLDSNFQNGISKLQDFNLTYDILAFDYQLPGAVKLVENFPEQSFVLDHMGKPRISEGVSAEWKKNIEQLAEHPNVYCKLSGFITQTKNFNWKAGDFRPFLDIVFKAFGEERLMFGSNWPVCLVAASYAQTVEIITAHFKENSSAREKIFGSTAEKFYNIQVATSTD